MNRKTLRKRLHSIWSKDGTTIVTVVDRGKRRVEVTVYEPEA